MIENTDMKVFKQLMAKEEVLADLRRFEDKSKSSVSSESSVSASSSSSESESHCDYLMRISPVGLYNTKQDIDRLVQVLG